MTSQQLQVRVREIERQLEERALAGWSSYPAVLDPDFERERLAVTLADDTVEIYDLTSTGQVVDP